MRLVTQSSCKVLSGSCCLLGAALSYHGCYLALAGRRVIPQRGTQSLTFPTGLEGLVFLQRSTLSPCPVLLFCLSLLGKYEIDAGGRGMRELGRKGGARKRRRGMQERRGGLTLGVW